MILNFFCEIFASIQSRKSRGTEGEQQLHMCRTVLTKKQGSQSFTTLLLSTGTLAEHIGTKHAMILKPKKTFGQTQSKSSVSTVQLISIEVVCKQKDMMIVKVEDIKRFRYDCDAQVGSTGLTIRSKYEIRDVACQFYKATGIVFQFHVIRLAHGTI